MSQFEKTDITQLSDNFFKRIGSQWMLVTAGDSNAFNTMTASWGGTGILWNYPVAFSFIRQSRYTLEFLNANDYYTLSFFGGEHMKELSFCGKHSGRDLDKIDATGLTPVWDGPAPYFAEADLVLVCRKLYRQTMSADCFLDKEPVRRWYADNDWHEIFVGEIVTVLKRS